LLTPAKALLPTTSIAAKIPLFPRRSNRKPSVIEHFKKLYHTMENGKTIGLRTMFRRKSSNTRGNIRERFSLENYRGSNGS